MTGGDMSTRTIQSTLTARTALCLVSVAFLCGMPGCAQDKVRGPSTANIDQLAPENYPKLVIEEPALAKVMAVTPARVVVDRPADRPMSVTVPVRSIADNTMRVQYRYIWFDDKGREVRTGEWRREVFAPRVERQLQGAAVDMKSTDWRLEVRSAL